MLQTGNHQEHYNKIMKNITTREELKKYFERGDRPTESQFSELIDGYVHLNELNFGLSIKPATEIFNKYYDFYKADDVANSGAGHIIIESEAGKDPQIFNGYHHVLSREVFYKKLHIELLGGIKIETHQPKIIIKRYKQKKRLRSGFKKKSGFYREKMTDAELWQRKSEYIVKEREMILDLEPIHYFRPNKAYKNFLPSGSLNKSGSFKYSRHGKAFVPITMQVEILINGIAYRSQPVGLKIILGSAGDTDSINYLLD